MFIIKVVLEYLTDLFFDTRDEYRFKSDEFKPIKFAIFLLVCSLLVYSIMITIRLFSIASDYNEDKDKLNTYIELESNESSCISDNLPKTEPIPKSIYTLEPIKLPSIE